MSEIRYIRKQTVQMNFEAFRKVIQTEGLELTVNSLLLQGPVFYFGKDYKKYFHFRNRLSEKLNVHTNDIAIVGSARLGFSLNQEKSGKSFDKDSDIDVAVVSKNLFERAWSELISIGEKKFYELLPKERSNLRECQSDIYWGYISPDRVPGGTGFSRWWWAIFEELSDCSEYEKRKIRGRLFESWKRAQMHYCYSIQKLLKTLAEGG